MIIQVHERSVDGDFLLLQLRELLKTNPNIKIILMSATINQQVFVDYFGGAPVLEIPGFTHPVKDIYLEDVISQINYVPPFVKGGPRQPEEQQRSFRENYQSQGLDQAAVRAVENITRSDRIDYQVWSSAQLTKHLVLTSLRSLWQRWSSI
jgi:ATP-dependent RNA helicase DHX57